MKITDELVEYVAALAKLELKDEEIGAAAKDLENIINYFNRLEQLDTEGIKEMTHSAGLVNVFREDEELSSFDRDLLLKNAPDKKDGYIKVPKTFD